MSNPVALIIDDDKSFLRRILNSFINNTFFGVLTASNLREALTIIQDDSLPLSVILSDVRFEHPHKAEDLGLNDGIDLLQQAHQHRPETLKYAISYYPDLKNEKARAALSAINIHGWFYKLDEGKNLTDDPIFNIQSSLIKLRTPTLGESYNDLLSRIDEKTNQELFADFLKAAHSVKFTKVTYLQNIGPDYKVNKPIKVLLLHSQNDSDSDQYSAKALCLGGLVEGRGNKPNTALDDLREKIAAHASAVFSSDDSKLAAYAELLHTKMKEYIHKS